MEKNNYVLGGVTKKGVELLYKNPEKFWEGIKEIGDYAFEGCDALISIEIPNSIIRIGAYAFKDCKRLVKVKLPEGLTLNGIGEKAFIGCTSLEELTLGNQITLKVQGYDEQTQKRIDALNEIIKEAEDVLISFKLKLAKLKNNNSND